MAAPALNSLIDEVQAEVNDESGVLATDAKVTSWINEAYWKAAEQIALADMGYFLVYNPVTTIDSTADYSTDAGMIAVKKVEVSYDGTNFYQANPINVSEDFPDRVYDQTSPFYMFVGDASGVDKIRIRPTPDAGEGGTARLRIYEYRYPTQLSGTNSPAAPLYGAYGLLKAYAKARFHYLRAADGDTGKADRYMDEFAKGVEDLIAKLNPRHMGPEFIKGFVDYDGYLSI